MVLIAIQMQEFKDELIKPCTSLDFKAAYKLIWTQGNKDLLNTIDIIRTFMTV